MTKYISDTLAAIDLKIGFLQGLRHKLEATFKDWTIEVEPEAGAGPRASRKARVKADSAERVASVKSPRTRNSSKIQELIGLAAHWPQPFGSAQIQKALRCNWKVASNCITRLNGLGYLRRVSMGQYERTATFPGAKPAGKAESHVTIPGLDAPELSPHEQLEQAIKQRDKAAADNNTTLQRIYQDRITKLENQLGL